MEPSEYVHCPFNKVHRVLRFRLPAHIIKCQKNYTGTPLDRCPFNGTHMVKKGELPSHLKECPDFHLSRKEEYERFSIS